MSKYKVVVDTAEHELGSAATMKMSSTSASVNSVAKKTNSFSFNRDLTGLQMFTAARAAGMLVVSVSVAFGMVLAPWISAFGGQGSSVLFICDIVWIISMCCRTANFGWQARKDLSSKHTRVFLFLMFGMLLCVPWDSLASGSSSAASDVVEDLKSLERTQLVRVLTCFRLLRGYRLDGFVQPMLYIQSRILKVACHQPVVRLVKLMLFIATLSHAAACFYIVAGNPVEVGNPSLSVLNASSAISPPQAPAILSRNFSSNWIENCVKERGGAPMDHYDVYLRALHMAIQSLLTVGFGESSPQSTAGNLLLLSLAFVGAVVYALMIASLTSIIKNVAAVSNSRQTIKEMTSYLELQGAPPEFQRQVTRYLRQVGQRFGGMSESDISQSCFSPEMQNKVIQRAAAIVQKVPLFQSFGIDFCVALACSARQQTFLEGEMLVNLNSFQPEILILIHGTAVGVCAKHNVVVQRFESGSTAIGLYNTIFRGAYAMSDKFVQASSICDVLVISQADFEAVLLRREFLSVQKAVSFVKSNKRVGSTPSDEISSKATDSSPTLKPIQEKEHKTSIHAALIATIQEHKKLSTRVQDLSLQQESSGIDILGTASEVDGKIILEKDLENPSPLPSNKSSASQQDNKTGDPVQTLAATATPTLFSHRTAEDVVLVVVVLWSLFAVPYRASHTYILWNSMSDENQRMIGQSFAVDYLCDLLMLVRFVMMCKRKKTQSISQMVLIAGILFPVDIFVIVQGDWATGSLLRLCRMMLVCYIPDFLRAVLSLMRHAGVEHFSAREEVLMTISTVVVITIHWLSCAWQSVNNDSSYIRAVYWCLVSISTTGFGELVPQTKVEICFSIAAMYIGATTFAALIACLASMQSARVTRHNASYRTQVLSQLCSSMSLSETTTNSVLTYNQYRAESVGNCDEGTLINHVMPHHYKMNMQTLLRLHVVQRNRMFSKCTTQFQQMIVEILEPCFVSKGETIATLDDSCPGMYFLEKGTAIIVRRRDQDCNGYGSGGGAAVLPAICFGERALFSELTVPSESSDSDGITATSDCILLLLRKEKFTTIVEKLPELYATLLEVVRKIHRNASTTTAATTTAMEEEGTKEQKEGKEIPLFGEDARSSTRFIPSAHENIILCSQMLAPIVLGIYMYLLPFQAAFLVHWNISSFAIVLDGLAYVVLIMEVVSSARGSKVLQHAVQNENDDKKTASRATPEYGFLVDAIALLPWECGASLLTSNTVGLLQAYAFLRLPKLLLLHNYKRYSRSLEPMLMWMRTICNDQFYTLGGLFIVFSTCAHVLACIWFMLSVQSTLTAESTWATEYQGLSQGVNSSLLSSCLPINKSSVAICSGAPVPDSTMQAWYVASVYYVFIALTTVGYGDIVAVNDKEYIFTICVIVLGTFILVYVLSKLEKIVANIDIASTVANRKAETLHEYVKLRKLPSTLEKRVHEYIELSWKQRCGATFDESMEYLGTRQKVQIVLEKIGSILETIPALEYYPARMLPLLAQHFHAEVLLPNQVLFEAEEVSDPFYVLIEGEIELLEPPPTMSLQQMQRGAGRRRRSYKETVYMTLEGPCAVCIETFFIEEPRPCTARGSKGCQLFSLYRSDMIECLKTDSKAWAKEETHKVEIEEALKKMSLVKTMKKNLSSTKLMKMQSMTAANDNVSGSARCMFAPHTRFRQAWAFLMVAAVMFDFIMFPVRLAFVASYEMEKIVVVIGMLLDVLHCVDLYLNLYRFSIVNDDGVVIDDIHVLIQRNLRHVPFYLRLSAALPLQAVLYLGVKNCTQTAMALSRVPKLFAMFQAGGGELESTLEQWGIKIDSGFFRTSKMGVAVLAVTHYVACFFLCLSSWQQVHTVGGITVVKADSFSRYIAATYWSAYTISTVGYGNVTLQDPSSLLFAMATSLVGTVLCGSGLSALLTYWIDGLDQMSGLTHLKQRCVDLYLQHYAYPTNQRSIVRKHLEYMAVQQKSIHEQYALSLLPPCLRADILCHFTLDATRSLLAPRQWTSSGLLRSLCLGMKSYVASIDEELLTVGKVANKLYVLIQGNVKQVMKAAATAEEEEEEEERETTLIPPRTAFGGNFETGSESTVTSLSISHLFYVDGDRYREILKFVSGARRSTENMMRTLQSNDVISNCRRGSSFSQQNAINELSKVRQSILAG